MLQVELSPLELMSVKHTKASAVTASPRVIVVSAQTRPSEQIWSLSSNHFDRTTSTLLHQALQDHIIGIQHPSQKGIKDFTRDIQRKLNQSINESTKRHNSSIQRFDYKIAPSPWGNVTQISPFSDTWWKMLRKIQGGYKYIIIFDFETFEVHPIENSDVANVSKGALPGYSSIENKITA